MQQKNKKDINLNILDVFAKLRNATVSFVMFICLSVRPHETTRLTVDGFW
jgi:hypothetical protein